MESDYVCARLDGIEKYTYRTSEVLNCIWSQMNSDKSTIQELSNDLAMVKEHVTLMKQADKSIDKNTNSILDAIHDFPDVLKQYLALTLDSYLRSGAVHRLTVIILLGLILWRTW